MLKLIIVDDEYEIRNGLANYFPWNEVGFEVVGVFENGQQALDYINTKPVDIVLSDIKMPILNGLELAKQLSAQKFSGKIVLLSAFTDFEYAKQAIEYKVAHYIQKPTKHYEIKEVFLKLKKEFSNSDESINSGEYVNKIISDIRTIVNDNLANSTLVFVADKMGRSVSYISRIFAEQTGETFTDYLSSVKMHKAKELLYNHHYRIYEISEMLGYTNPKNFSRAYKKHFGYAPSEIRSGNKE